MRMDEEERQALRKLRNMAFVRFSEIGQERAFEIAKHLANALDMYTATQSALEVWRPTNSEGFCVELEIMHGDVNFGFFIHDELKGRALSETIRFRGEQWREMVLGKDTKHAQESAT